MEIIFKDFVGHWLSSHEETDELVAGIAKRAEEAGCRIIRFEDNNCILICLPAPNIEKIIRG